jgi:hypothetical protein
MIACSLEDNSKQLIYLQLRASSASRVERKAVFLVGHGLRVAALACRHMMCRHVLHEGSGLEAVPGG